MKIPKNLLEKSLSLTTLDFNLSIKGSVLKLRRKFYRGIAIVHINLPEPYRLTTSLRSCDIWNAW